MKTNLWFNTRMSQMKHMQKEIQKSGVIIKNGYAQNVVPTTTGQNMVAAAQEETLSSAQGKFRALEYANDRGTGGEQFDLLAYEWQKVQWYNEGSDEVEWLWITLRSFFLY